MDAMDLDDVEQMEIQQDSDWLEVDISAHVSSKIVSLHRTNDNKHSSQTEDDNQSDFTPFDPDYQTTDCNWSFQTFPKSKIANLIMLTF